MLREAIDDVMSSLDDMTLVKQDSERDTEREFNPWSPEAFDNFRQPQDRPTLRPLTSLGLGAGGSNYSETRQSYSSRHNSPDRYQDGQGPPQLETYVQRMESRLRHMQEAREGRVGSEPPEPPPKNSPWSARPESAMAPRRPSIKNRKSAYELRDRETLGRSYTTKTNSTNSSSGAQSVATNCTNQSSMTSQSLMSGYSAGGFSATSAGSLARRGNKLGSIRDRMTGRPMTSAGTRAEQQQQHWNQESTYRPTTPGAISYHSSHDSRQGARSAVGWQDSDRPTDSGGLGGFTTPKSKKSGFLKKLIDSAKTSAASARTTIAVGPPSNASSPTKSFNNGIAGIAGGTALSLSPAKGKQMNGFGNPNPQFGLNAANEMGLGGSSDWFSTRRDVNRSNTPGPAERQERVNRCQMLDQAVIYPVEELYEGTQGDEGADGQPVYESFQISNPSFSQVDKAARFITSLPPTVTAAALATGYVCRPYRSDVQRLRAMFIWCAERVAWEEDMDDGYEGADVDTRRLIQTKRGCSKEVAALIVEMCAAIGIHAEIVRGYLKTPGEELDLDAATRPNHYWNTVVVDDEWRMMDCSIASPTNPRRSLYSNVSTSIAEAWYFLARPSEIAWSHIPFEDQQQHLVPSVGTDILLALPGACPSFFRLGLGMHAYDTSLLRLEGLEVCTVVFSVPTDIEIVAEVEAKTYHKDGDGDLYEDADKVTKKSALAQASWYKPNPVSEVLQKRYIVKAVLPSDEGMGVLKIYAGKKGLMHSSRDIVHPLALALPLYHTGENPAFEFIKRHPTPHATRQDLYVVQPQCWRLGVGETYVFCVRQHQASTATTPAAVEQAAFDFRPVSPNPFHRPGSAMSMTSSSAAGSNQGSDQGSGVVVLVNGVKTKEKPAKLAVQSPGGKIMRLNRKADGLPQPPAARDLDGELLGSVWETAVKVHERGVWRGLVLADRSARWCVWGEWEAF